MVAILRECVGSVFGAAVLAAVTLCGLSAAGQDLETEKPAKALEFPATWVNSDPISLESLRGKAVFLYFFEETCPKCRDRWPSLMDKAREYADEPILFVAVNSGSPKQTVEAYARSVNLTWPVIVDQDRSFEDRAEIVEISLQNVMQVAFVTASGELRHGQWADIDGTIDQALAGAKWNVDPDGIPDDLMPAWRSLEFCQFAIARPAITKGLTSRKADVKAAAEKLSNFVQERGERDLAAADKSAAAGNKWRAYQRDTRRGRGVYRLCRRRQGQHGPSGAGQGSRAEKGDRRAQAIREAARAGEFTQAGRARKSA